MRSPETVLPDAVATEGYTVAVAATDRDLRGTSLMASVYCKRGLIALAA